MNKDMVYTNTLVMGINIQRRSRKIITKKTTKFINLMAGLDTNSARF